MDEWKPGIEYPGRKKGPYETAAEEALEEDLVLIGHDDESVKLQAEQMARLRRQFGWSYISIATAYGYNRQTVVNRIKGLDEGITRERFHVVERVPG